jgi:hypothetical protein
MNQHSVLRCNRRPRGPLHRLGAVVLTVIAAGCGDSPTGPAISDTAGLVVQASLAGTPASALVLEVAAPDIPVDLLFNLPVQGEWAESVVRVPAGPDRRFTARAFDVSGMETHRGTRTRDVRAGDNAAMTITLLPLQGEQPIVVTVGSYAVAVSPGDVALDAGEQALLQATVTDADGMTVDDARVQWASLDTDVATVGDTGLVTARAPGEARIVAVYGGAGATALVTVTE